MPFPDQPGKPFTRPAIENLNPGQYGVYGIYRPNVWIYVGMGDIRQRLLDHLNGDNPCITANQPTGFVAAVTTNAVELEKQLIRELNPVCNKRVG
jgi:hypothetical protein